MKILSLLLFLFLPQLLFPQEFIAVQKKEKPGKSILISLPVKIESIIYKNQKTGNEEKKRKFSAVFARPQAPFEGYITEFRDSIIKIGFPCPYTSLPDILPWKKRNLQFCDSMMIHLDAVEELRLVKPKKKFIQTMGKIAVIAYPVLMLTALSENLSLSRDTRATIGYASCLMVIPLLINSCIIIIPVNPETWDIKMCKSGLDIEQ